MIDFLTGSFARGYPRLFRIDDIANLRGVDRSLIYRRLGGASTRTTDAFTLVLEDLRNRLVLERISAGERTEAGM